MVNVLVHIEDNDSALTELMQILKPGGHLLLFVPALQFLFSDIDELHGHYRRYHLKTLTDLLEQKEFQIRSRQYFDLASVLPWWLINTVSRKNAFDPNMVSFYDQFVITESRFLEKRISPPIGRNIIIVAEKLPA
jgi:SAM-dependent methyltransferase